MNQIELKKARGTCLIFFRLNMSNAMNRKELTETINFILDNIDSSRIVMNSVASIRDKLIDLTIEEQVISEQDFYKISSVLSTQSRSPLWENYFINRTYAAAIYITGDFSC